MTLSRPIIRVILTLFLICFLFNYTKSVAAGPGGFPCSGDSTGLIKAALNEQIDKVKSLLDKGVQADTRDVNCYTPLMWAANTGNTDIVIMLLDRGADINAVNRDLNTPLILAIRGKGSFLYPKGKHADVVKILIKRGANVNWKNDRGETALDEAHLWGIREIVEILKQAGMNK